MTSAIQQGIINYLAAQLSAASVTLGSAPETGQRDERITITAADIPISGDVVQSTSLHCFISKGEKPPLLPWIICDCQPLRHRAGILYDGQIDIGVSTPQNQAGIDETTHRAIFTAVLACFPDMQSVTAALAEAVGDDAIAAATAALAAAAAQQTALGAATQTASGYQCSSFTMEFALDSLTEDRWTSTARLKALFLKMG